MIFNIVASSLLFITLCLFAFAFYIFLIREGVPPMWAIRPGPNVVYTTCKKGRLCRVRFKKCPITGDRRVRTLEENVHMVFPIRTVLKNDGTTTHTGITWCWSETTLVQFKQQVEGLVKSAEVEIKENELKLAYYTGQSAVQYVADLVEAKNRDNSI